MVQEPTTQISDPEFLNNRIKVYWRIFWWHFWTGGATPNMTICGGNYRVLSSCEMVFHFEGSLFFCAAFALFN